MKDKIGLIKSSKIINLHNKVLDGIEVAKILGIDEKIVRYALQENWQEMEFLISLCPKCDHPVKRVGRNTNLEFMCTNDECDYTHYISGPVKKIRRKRCKVCKELYTYTIGLGLLDSQKGYCSKDCMNKNNQNYLKKQKTTLLMKCKNCGIDWYVHEKYADSKRIFCSEKCRIEYDSKQPCLGCESIGNIYKDNFCFDCYFKSFATKCNNCGKILKKNRKYAITPEKYEIISPGIKDRYQVSNSQYCNIRCIIEKESPYYYEGIGKEEYPNEFNIPLKERILKRDNYICQICEGNHRLAIHHIDYDKTNNIPLNLVTLCNSCHTKTNYNRVPWVKLFSNFVIQWHGEQTNSVEVV